MNAHVKRKLKKIIAPIRRIGLKNKDFTIISNNCWGGYIYDRYGLQYRTPTIGGILYPEDYIKFISRLPYYLSIEMKQITVQESKYRDLLIEKSRNMVGRIDDIEVIFIHYSSIEDAVRKWNKRRKRVNYNNILFKFNDQNNFIDKCYDDFIDLKFKNKIFFTSNKNFITRDYCYFIKEFEDKGFAVDDLKASKGIVDYKKLLNSLQREENIK